MPTIPRRQTPDPRRKKAKRDRPQDTRYWSNAWRKARTAYIRNHPECVDCGRIASVVDHIEPVRLGGEFWDSSNWQSMCTRCHNAKSGREAHEG
ncbi:MAG: HNH endonuclease signature motif containing protein [Pseudohongiellaceae bacterium]